MPNKRGRPSKIEDPDIQASVYETLESCSKPSTHVVSLDYRGKNADPQLRQVKTLEQKLSVLWNTRDALYTKLSFEVFKKLVKRSPPDLI